jgi:hypothetical protein
LPKFSNKSPIHAQNTAPICPRPAYSLSFFSAYSPDKIISHTSDKRVLKDKVDYVFQVKENQEGVLDAVKETFKDRKNVESAAKSFSKKKVA